MNDGKCKHAVKLEKIRELVQHFRYNVFWPSEARGTDIVEDVLKALQKEIDREPGD